MSNIPYSMLIRNSKHPELIRERMVKRYYEVMNYSQVAREYGTKRQRVKFWMESFEEEGMKGLEDKSRAPHSLPNKTPKEIEEKIREIAKAKKYSIGQDRIQSELRKEGIKRSTSTINQIMHSLDLIKKRLKKYQRKRQVSEYRKELKALRN